MEKNKLSGIIYKGRLKIVCSGFGIKLYWNEIEVTQGVGLNSAINTLGMWSDSSFANWQILENGSDYFNIKVIFKSLPLNQIWKIRIENEREINFQVEMEAESDLNMEERRVICLVSPRYKTWINEYEQGDFPQVRNWQDMPLGNMSSRLIGVRFPAEGPFIPYFCLEFQDNYSEQIYPFIQNTSEEANAHLLGIRMIDKNRYFLPGSYKFFSGKIMLFDDNRLLDEKMERCRKLQFKKIQNGLPSQKIKNSLKLLLVNLPWQKDGKLGVRAGSRWPHIKDKSEGNYLPFPFFLAHAVSLLHKHGIDAYMIDAIADEMPEDNFMEEILSLDFDYLVTETSVPSFFYDLRMLERIHRAGVSIILCGPNALTNTEKFLQENPFIDFVLYGEYEFSLLELIKYLQERKDLSGVNGLIYRSKKGIIKNPPRQPWDINLLPWPYRDGLNMEKYWDLPGNIPTPSAQMLASRGCPFGCDFCLWPQVFYQGNHYRIRDIADVVKEMEYLIRRKRFKSVYFDDDTFNIGKERMLEFCKAVKEKDLQGTPWAIMARPDLMDEEILEAFKSAGLRAVKYGVESFSRDLVKSCHKSMNTENAARMIRFTKELGIKIHLTFCFGLRQETKESIQRTIDYALDLDPESIQFSILTPFPGTRIFAELDQEGRILTYDWALYDGHHCCVFKPDNLTPEDLEVAKRRAYILWGEHVRKRRGLRGDIKRFNQYIRQHGYISSMWKTFDYLKFIWLKKRGILDEKH